MAIAEGRSRCQLEEEKAVSAQRRRRCQLIFQGEVGGEVRVRGEVGVSSYCKEKLVSVHNKKSVAVHKEKSVSVYNKKSVAVHMAEEKSVQWRSRCQFIVLGGEAGVRRKKVSDHVFVR
jgi:hypothetical protein